MTKEDSSSKPSIPKSISSDVRLGSYSPLRTILEQTSGPYTSILASATYGVVDSYWVKKALGEIALTAVGAAYFYENIAYAFAHFLSASVIAKIGYLNGKNQKQESSQIIIDMIRFTFLFGILIPLILIPSSKLFPKWLGSDDTVSNLTFQFLIPTCGLSIITQNYLVLCGVLLTEGRSNLYGILQVTSSLLNMLILDPLFLLYFKFGIWGASLASIISQFIPLIILYYIVFSGKLEVKPTFSQFFLPISSEFFSSLSLGSTTLIIQLANLLPFAIFMKTLSIRSLPYNLLNQTLTGLNIYLRVFFFLVALDIALSQALLPSASYAMGAKNYPRFISLCLNALSIGTIYNAFVTLIIILFSSNITKIFVTEPSYYQWTKDFLDFGHYAFVFIMTRIVFTVALQAARLVKHATIFGLLTQFVPVPLFAFLVFFLDSTKNPRNLLYVILAGPIFSSILSVIYYYCLKDSLFPKDEEKKDEDIEQNV